MAQKPTNKKTPTRPDSELNQDGDVMTAKEQERARRGNPDPKKSKPVTSRTNAVTKKEMEEGLPKKPVQKEFKDNKKGRRNAKQSQRQTENSSENSLPTPSETSKKQSKSGGKEDKQPFDKTYGRTFDEIVYPEVGLMLYQGENALTAQDAAEILGWTEEDKEGGVIFGNNFRFRDLIGNKVRLMNNPTNRPFKRNLALRYANEILRGKWKLNGESMILDKRGRCLSCQHRLAGVVFAQQMLSEDPDKWTSEFHWDLKKGISIECILVTGINDDKETVDTIDLAAKRSLADVFYRSDEFDGDQRAQEKLTKVLAGAIRLVWLRAGGQTVSSAPHFPHSEAVDFLGDHPRIKECVSFINTANSGPTGETKTVKGKEKPVVDNSRITSYISMGYAAGLMYLMATSGTDGEKYLDGAPGGKLSFKMLDKAKEFWNQFVGITPAKGERALNVKQLKDTLAGLSQSGAASRDEVIGTVIKAFNAWMDPKAPQKIVLERDSDGVLTEKPLLGGLDIDVSGRAE